MISATQQAGVVNCKVRLTVSSGGSCAENEGLVPAMAVEREWLSLNSDGNKAAFLKNCPPNVYALAMVAVEIYVTVAFAIVVQK
jgi:hypothetical protein